MTTTAAAALPSAASRARSRPLPSKTSVPSAPAAAATRRPSAAALSDTASPSSAIVCTSAARPERADGRGSHTLSVRSAAALHTRQRSGELVRVFSGSQTGSSARSAEPPPTTERRQSAERASHSLVPRSSPPDSTIDAPRCGDDGGAPGEHTATTAPRWATSVARGASVAASRTARRPSDRPAHSSSSQPKAPLGCAPLLAAPEGRSAGAGFTVSTTARHCTGLSTAAVVQSAPSAMA